MVVQESSLGDAIEGSNPLMPNEFNVEGCKFESLETSTKRLF